MNNLNLSKVIEKIAETTLGKVGYEIILSLSDSLHKSILEQLAINNFFREYELNFRDRYGKIKILEMSRDKDLMSVFTPNAFVNEINREKYHLTDDILSLYNQGIRRFRKQNIHPLRGIHLANEYQYLMILGGPGSGKSTYLKYVGIEALNGVKGRFRFDSIPVFIELKGLDYEKGNISKIIENDFIKSGFNLPSHFVKKGLEKGKFLVLLDGLDEVPIKKKGEALEIIQEFVFQYPSNHFILSCRTAAREPIRKFEEFELAFFDDKEIEHFVDNWFCSELDKQNKTAQKCLNTLNAHKHVSAREFAKTPLLLTFICMVYDKKMSLPTNRSYLYEKAIDILLEDWTASKRLDFDSIHSILNIEQEKVLLSEIAYFSFLENSYLIHQDIIEQKVKEFIECIVETKSTINAIAIIKNIELYQGIILNISLRNYSFSHIAIHEYFVAKYVSIYILNDTDRIEELIGDYLLDTRWKEVFILVAGLTPEPDRLLKRMIMYTKTVLDTHQISTLNDWTQSITISDSESSPPINRILVLFIVLGIILDYEYAYLHDFQSSQDVDKLGVLEQDTFHRRENEIHSQIQLLEEVLANARNLVTAMKVNLYLDRSRFAGLAHSYAASKIGLERINKLEIINTIRILSIASKLDLMKDDLQGSGIEENSSEYLIKCKKISEVWLNSLSFKASTISSSSSMLRELSHYFYACELIMLCYQTCMKKSKDLRDGIRNFKSNLF